MVEHTEDETVEITLIDAKTGLPLDEDDPIILSKDDYNFIVDFANSKEVSFDEAFILLIRLGMESEVVT